jgi:hypothetical protein
MAEPTYWPDVDLDLTGATLLDWQLTNCTVRSIECVGTRFIGDCAFDNTEFQRAVRFDSATFDGPVTFIGMTFVGAARFSMALFEQDVLFYRARFSKVMFADSARFVTTQFSGDAQFDGAKVKLDVPSTVVRAWPRGFSVGVGGPGPDGDWGLLTDGR